MSKNKSNQPFIFSEGEIGLLSNEKLVDLFYKIRDEINYREKYHKISNKPSIIIKKIEDTLYYLLKEREDFENIPNSEPHIIYDDYNIRGRNFLLFSSECDKNLLLNIAKLLKKLLDKIKLDSKVSRDIINTEDYQSQMNKLNSVLETIYNITAYVSCYKPDKLDSSTTNSCEEVLAELLSISEAINADIKDDNYFDYRNVRKEIEQTTDSLVNLRKDFPNNKFPPKAVYSIKYGIDDDLVFLYSSDLDKNLLIDTLNELYTFRDYVNKMMYYDTNKSKEKIDTINHTIIEILDIVNAFNKDVFPTLEKEYWELRKEEKSFNEQSLKNIQLFNDFMHMSNASLDFLINLKVEKSTITRNGTWFSVWSEKTEYDKNIVKNVKKSYRKLVKSLKKNS